MKIKKTFDTIIPASKSIMNRALLVQSFFPEIQIEGNSNCDDVVHMKKAISSMIRKQDIFCGDAAAVLRFMAMRCSRIPGQHKLTGSLSLFKRPHEEINFILSQLGVFCELTQDQLIITSEGWKRPLVPVHVHRETSSQFASGLLLSSWNLPFDLELEVKTGASEPYWNMSTEMAGQLGMNLLKRGSVWKVAMESKAQVDKIQTELDFSSAFPIAVAGALAGQTKIRNTVEQSLQADFVFVELLRKMNVRVQNQKQVLIVDRPDEIQPIEFNLENAPDLFPCLAVLCAFAKGESVLSGLQNLVYKESNRLEKTIELLRLAGVHCILKEKTFHVIGHGFELKPKSFNFDPDHDHRMAFAAGLFMLMGFQIRLKDPHVVSKSFPEYWKTLGIKL